MADISKRFGLRHLRAAPTSHIRHLRRGQVARDGAGLAFWFRPLVAALSEVPVDDRELAMLFHARTVDFQDVTVQATVTFRITEPATAAARLDFSVDPDTGIWRAGLRPAHVQGLHRAALQEPDDGDERTVRPIRDAAGAPPRHDRAAGATCRPECRRRRGWGCAGRQGRGRAGRRCAGPGPVRRIRVG
ncbi:hypothetical protein FCI23_26695 [Actinacidiphila oryziradicis]|uniref:Band 7 domain-containing protein n=1 Tax=Actinacidiphila oryziradicis TaxID=2571141 RepID=A0A4V5MZM1_9ACTN|nr:hypothetical protein FCI23_26695 [Actinacidiphila oryziradicis]